MRFRASYFADLVREVPLLVRRRLRSWTVLPFAIVSVAAIVFLPRIRLNPEIQLTRTGSDDLARRTKETEERLAPSDYVLIAVPVADPYDSGALSAVERISTRAAAVPGVGKVLSVATATEVTLEDEALVSRPLYRSAVDATLRDRVSADPLLQRYLLSPDGRALSVWIFPEREARDRPLIEALDVIVREETGNAPILFGRRAVRYSTERAVARDATLLGPLCFVVVLAALCLISGSLRLGALLWVGTVLPTLWTLGLFGILGVELSVWNLVVPFQVLALSTSFGIHLVRDLLALESPDVDVALRLATPVIGWAGFTTLLGFATLLLSPLSELRVMGALLVVGIAFALLCALFLLPALLARLPLPRRPARRPGAARNGSSRVGSALRVAFAAAVVLLVAGIPRIGVDFRFDMFLGRSSETGRSLTFVESHYGGLYELSLVVDTGEQYGLADPSGFAGIREVERRLQGLSGVDEVISVVPFVDRLSRVLAEPGSQGGGASVGESLELLSGFNPGIRIDSLIDTEYRRARLIVRFDPGRVSPREAESAMVDLSNRIANTARAVFPDTDSLVLGYPLEARRVVQDVQGGQLRGVVIDMAITFGVVAILLRSLRWGVVALIPPLVGLGVYYGLMGWFGLTLTALASLVAAAVLGVGIDDVLCLIVTYRRTEVPEGAGERVSRALTTARRAIIETNAANVAGISVLLLSLSPVLAQSGLQIAAALSFSTATTVLVVPGLIRLIFGAKGGRSGPKRRRGPHPPSDAGGPR